MFHAVWLDDNGEVVRETRITAQDECDYVSVAGEDIASETQLWLSAKIGARYMRYAEHDPPFGEIEIAAAADVEDWSS